MKSVILIHDPSTPEQEKFWSQFDNASRAIKAAKTTAGTESNYGIAYQNLVREGLVMPLKRKYR